MPLCLFGCDYIYETGQVYIDAGMVKKSDYLNCDYCSELDYINTLIGNKLESRWLKGSDYYFPKPEKKKQSDV